MHTAVCLHSHDPKCFLALSGSSYLTNKEIQVQMLVRGQRPVGREEVTLPWACCPHVKEPGKGREERQPVPGGSPSSEGPASHRWIAADALGMGLGLEPDTGT